MTSSARTVCWRAPPQPAAPVRPRPPSGPLGTGRPLRGPQAAGKTTALVYTGGTEQRGPQNVNGGHTLMGREIVRTVALRLGNAIAMPVLPYTPNTASADLPGTIGLTPELLSAILERVSEQAIATGFKNVIIMGDHGGGQPDAYRTVATKLEAKYAPKAHVYFCDEVYKKAQDDFDAWLVAHGYPRSSHAGIPDTSTMLYLGGDKGWVRKELIPTAEGDPVPEPGQRGRGRANDPNAPSDPNAAAALGTPAPRKNNGISGDARKSTAALGKMAFDIKIDYAVKQIQGFLANQTKTTAQP